MNIDKTMEAFNLEMDFIKSLDIHDFLEAWGDELTTAGFVINDHGQIVLYTGARINKETGEFEYGTFDEPYDQEAFIPGVSETTFMKRTQEMTDAQAKAIQDFAAAV